MTVAEFIEGLTEIERGDNMSVLVDVDAGRLVEVVGFRVERGEMIIEIDDDE